MRITARLDDESKKYLFKIQKFKNSKISKVLLPR